MYIIPVDEYQELWGSNDDATISNTIDAIFGYTVAIPEPAPAAGVPVLPMEEVFGEQDLAVQLGRTGALEGAATVSGYRRSGNRETWPGRRGSRSKGKRAGLNWRRG